LVYFLQPRYITWAGCHTHPLAFGPGFLQFITLILA
jgi:hypothetical protein